MDKTQAVGLVGSLAIYLSALAAVTKLVDWLMPPKAKAALQSCVERVWLWLAEQRIGPFFRHVHDARWIRSILFIFCVIPLVWIAIDYVALYADASKGIGLMPEALCMVFGLMPGVSLAFGVLTLASFLPISKLVAWIVAKQTPMSTLLRMATLCVMWVIPVLLFLWAMTWTQGSVSDDKMLFGCFGVAFLATSIAVTMAVTLSPLAWFVLLGVAAVLLKVSEFFVRRLAEHPNGPVLGTSALVGALGALLKSLE